MIRVQNLALTHEKWTLFDTKKIIFEKYTHLHCLFQILTECFSTWIDFLQKSKRNFKLIVFETSN